MTAMTANERETHRAERNCRVWGRFDYRCHRCQMFDGEVNRYGVALAITTYDRAFLASLRIKAPDLFDQLMEN